MKKTEGPESRVTGDDVLDENCTSTSNAAKQQQHSPHEQDVSCTNHQEESNTAQTCDGDEENNALMESPSVEDTIPSATETASNSDDDGTGIGTTTTKDEDQNDHDDDNVSNEDLDDLIDFLFEDHHAKKIQRFDWVVGGVQQQQEKEDQEHQQQPARRVHVSLESITDEDPGALQSGHYVWPAAQLMVEYMTTYSVDGGGAARRGTTGAAAKIASIIELGAGCGLASLVALQVYQETLQCLIVTDRDVTTLERARENYETTLEDLLNTSHTDDEFNTMINDIASIPVCFEVLHWGGPSDLKTISHSRRNIHHIGGGGTSSSSKNVLNKILDDERIVRELLTEHTNDHSDTADLILGTDLIYCIEVVEPLLSTACRLMKKPTTTVLSREGSSGGDGKNNDVSGIGDNQDYCGGGRLWLSQSYLYGDDVEARINTVCDRLNLIRTTVMEDGPDKRVQEFRHKEIEAL